MAPVFQASVTFYFPHNGSAVPRLLTKMTKHDAMVPSTLLVARKPRLTVPVSRIESVLTAAGALLRMRAIYAAIAYDRKRSLSSRADNSTSSSRDCEGKGRVLLLPKWTSSGKGSAYRFPMCGNAVRIFCLHYFSSSAAAAALSTG